MAEPIEERSGHLGVTEDRCPVAEAQVCGDHHACALIELAEKVEQQCASRGAERQVSQLVEDHQVGFYQRLSGFPGFA